MLHSFLPSISARLLAVFGFRLSHRWKNKRINLLARVKRINITNYCLGCLKYAINPLENPEGAALTIGN
jgi:hypothetical protein